MTTENQSAINADTAAVIAAAVAQAITKQQDKPDALKRFEDMNATETEHEFAEQDVQRNPMTGRIIRGPDGAFDKTNVAFSSEAVFSKVATYDAGGVPTYVDIDYITISIPGDMTTVIHSQATEYYKWLYPYEWAAYEQGKEAVLIGTPLSLWPVLTKSQVKDLEYKGIRTVEQLASMSDSNNTQFAGFYALKGKAQQFLDAKGKSDAAMSLQLELDERDKSHKLELEVMKEQLRQMAEMMQAQVASREDAPTAKKSTYKKKSADSTPE